MFNISSNKPLNTTSVLRSNIVGNICFVTHFCDVSLA